MELEQKMEQESMRLANELDAMNVKADNYGMVLNYYETVTKMLNEETRRVNAIQQMKLEAQKLEIEKDRNEIDSMQKRLNADLEEERLKHQVKADRWRNVVQVGGWCLAIVGNVVTIAFSIWCNRQGDTTTTFQNKFVLPLKTK